VQLLEEGKKGACHLLVEVKGHHDITSKKCKTIHAAVDVARDRVIRQLTEVRDKILTVRRRPKKFSFERHRRALNCLQGRPSR
jgi:ribosome-associated translation inhibitor RaiA